MNTIHQFLENLGLPVGSKMFMDVTWAVGGFVTAIIFLAIFRRVLGNRIDRWARRRAEYLDAELLEGCLSRVHWFLNTLTLFILFRMLPLSATFEKWTRHIFLVAFTIVSVSLVFALATFILDLYLRKRNTTFMGHRGRVTLPIIKSVVWIIAAAFLMDNFGVEVKTILAGLGVAGIAVGFAAQAVLGDLFSYFAILFDRPFRIGDFIIIDTMRGTIEHIGLKTSRIRSLDGEQIIMSNSDLTNSRVKNLRRMWRRRILFQFGVIYSTPADKLEEIPAMVRLIVDNTPLATLDRVHFFRFGESSLDFEVVYYVGSPEYNDYMDAQQDINLALVRRFEQEGIDFAYPTRTLHMHQEESNPTDDFPKGDATN